MKDSVREAWLADNGWEFDYEPAVPLEMIAVNKSLQAQIRLEALDELLVSKYVQARRDGAQFPAIILVQSENRGPLPIADGVHRFWSARKAGLKALDAYIVTNATTEKQAELLRRSANAMVGKGFDTKQSIAQAVALVESGGWNAREAAKVMHVSESSVTKKLRTIAVAPRVARVMAPMTAARVVLVTPEGVLDGLARIRRQDVFETATRIAMRGKLASREVDALVQEGNAAITDREAQALLEEWHKKYAVELSTATVRGDSGGKRHMRNAPRERLDRAITMLKGALTTIKNNVDGRKLDAETRKYAADTLRWGSGELIKMARRIAEGKSGSGD